MNESGQLDSEYQDYLMYQAYVAISEIYDIKLTYDEFIKKMDHNFAGCNQPAEKA